MNTFLYDVLRVLRNRGVLLVMAMTSLLSFTALTIFVAVSRPQSAFQLNAEETIVVLIMGLIYAFFVPILGIQSGYSTYARDRATGVLESVLVRPVTRTQIILSRYIAVVIASAIAIAIALGVLDGLAASETGALLPAGQLGGLYVGLLVEATAFAGLLFLLAHLLRSPGAIMGSAVVVFVLIDIVWFFLLLFVGVFFGGLATTSGLSRVVGLEYADPAGFPFLMLAWVQGGLFGGLIQPPGGLGSIGISAPSLIAAGVFWSVAPFLVAVWLARTRD